MKRAAWSLLVLIALAALAAPWLAPNPPNRRFDDLLYAPPTPVHIFSDGLHAPFINPWRSSVASSVASRRMRQHMSRCDGSPPVRL